MAGLPTLTPLRGFLAACDFARSQAAEFVVAAAATCGLPSPVQATLEGYRDRGLPGVSPHLDYRR